jgi:hypothetical protein
LSGPTRPQNKQAFRCGGKREAGPYQTIPYPGSDWHEAGKPKQQPHEYFRDGTAKLLTLFRPATGEVRAKGVEHAPNAVLHPWLKEELLAILAQQEKEHPFVFPSDFHNA